MADFNVGAILGGVNSVVSAVSEHSLAKTQYEMQVAAQGHNSAMRDIQFALSRNAEADQRVQLHDASVRAATAIGIASTQDKAAAEVAAAASGTGGSTVEGTSRGLEQSFLRAHAARKSNENAALRGIRKDALNTEMSHVFGRDLRTFERPSGTSALLGLGTTLLKQWDDNQPEGDKIADTLANFKFNL
tara:strand:- start:7799 stop:8365 length:567 start_codon:yes stop_codon:yes gene_type:complete